MKSDIHPEYNAIVFRDLASGETFLTHSTLTSEKMANTWMSTDNMFLLRARPP